jgi:hypothetical protein
MKPEHPISEAITRAIPVFEQAMLDAGVPTIIGAAGVQGIHFAVFTGQTRDGEHRGIVMTTRVQFSEVIEGEAAIDRELARVRTEVETPDQGERLRPEELRRILDAPPIARVRIPAIIEALETENRALRVRLATLEGSQ